MPLGGEENFYEEILTPTEKGIGPESNISVNTVIYSMTRAAQLNRPPSRTRAARSGGAVRPSLADCKAVFQAKTSRQPYSKKRYSACKWSRPFLYRKEDNEYRKGKKRHLDWVGRRLSRPRKTMKDRFKSKLHDSVADYDKAYRDQVNKLKSELKSAETNLKNDEASLKPGSTVDKFIGHAKWISKGRRVVSQAKKALASLERRRTTPDIRDLPNVDLSRRGSLRGKLSDLQTDLFDFISPYKNPARRYSA